MKTYPHWVFDGSAIADPLGHGERAVKFLKFLKHPKSAAPGRAFTLDAWQERIVRRIYGPRHDDGTRIVKTVFLMLPRGNRKTALAAALGLLHTIGPERVPAGEIVTAAADQKQARLAFDEAAAIVRGDKRLASLGIRITDHRNRLTYSNEGTRLEALSSDGATQHGRTPALVIADELHAWKKRELWDVLRSGLPKTTNSLCVIITTAGRGQDNISHELYAYARKVTLGEIDDPAFLPILFEAGADEDWKDEAVWHRVNPGLCCTPPYPDVVGLRQLAREAANRPGDREAFRQLHLNVWLDHSTTPFVEMAVWDQGAAPIDEEQLADKPCWLGVDLSSTTDLTAIVAAWPDGQDGFIVRPWFFCPGDNLRVRADRDGVPYPRWADENYIEPTPGNVIDFRRVEEVIRDLCRQYDVREIAFDPHMGRNMIANLLDDGLPAVEMRQGWVTMAPAIRELERAIVAGKLQHGAHPVLRWNVSNIALHIDQAGNRTFSKGKAKDRIDGAVATAMAVGRASQGNGGSIYTNSSARPEGLIFI